MSISQRLRAARVSVSRLPFNPSWVPACLRACLPQAQPTPTHSGHSSADPTGRGSPSGQNYPVVFSLSQCHLENRGALRAVVSGNRGRTRVPDRQRRRPLLTIALDARQVTSSGDGRAPSRGARRRCITRTTRRRQPPRQMTTASLSSSPISVWQPSRPTARTDGRCHWDRSRASTACLRRRSSRGSRGAALRPAQWLFSDRNSIARPAVCVGGRSARWLGRMGHADGIPAYRWPGTARRARHDAARLLLRSTPASLSGGYRSARVARWALPSRTATRSTCPQRAPASRRRPSTQSSTMRHQQGSAPLAGGVPRRQGDGRALRLGRHRWRRVIDDGMEYDPETSGRESMAPSPSIPEPLEGSWTRQRFSGAHRKISPTFQRRCSTRTSCIS